MKNNLQIFIHPQFGELEVWIDEEGNTWFPATDCAHMLAYANPHDAITKHCKTKGVAYREVLTAGGKQKKKYIDLSNYLRLIARSSLPSAQQVESWIFDEIMPSIIKTGSYTYALPNSGFNIPSNYIDALRLAADIEEQRAQAQAQIEANASLVAFAEAVQASKDSILVGELSKLLKQNGIEIGRKKLFSWLRKNGYLMKIGEEKNQPTQYSMNLKLFELKKGVYTDSSGYSHTTTTTKVTAKGQTYFVNLFLKEDAKANQCLVGSSESPRR